MRGSVRSDAQCQEVKVGTEMGLELDRWDSQEPRGTLAGTWTGLERLVE